MELLLAFLAEYGAALSGGAAALAIIETIFKPFRSLYALWKKPDEVSLDRPTLEALVPRETGKLHVAEFLRIRREMKADLEEELAAAHEDEKAQLRARIAELESDIANPDEALAEADKTIADLTARLERMGNEIGGARLAEARAALERLDFSVADEIFAEVEARQELAVQEAARAAYGRGEVAEAEVRWADAAAHYARSARLAPDYQTLKKASDLAERSGDYAAAIAQSTALVAFCEENGTREELSDALNEHALNHRARGELAEAERLYRQALEIDKATLGEAHPDYATGLNNLAEVLRARGDLAEAERLQRQALEIDKATLGEGHPDYATGLNNLAEVLRARGDLAEAERLFRQALEIDRAALGEAHPQYARHAINLADLLAETGRREEAGPLFAAGLQALEVALGAAHPDTRRGSSWRRSGRRRGRGPGSGPARGAFVSQGPGGAGGTGFRCNAGT